MANNVVNKNDGLVKKRTVGDAQNTGGFDGAIIYVEANKTIYEYKASSVEIVNGTTILNTVDGGSSRWIGISGQFGIYGSGVKPMLIVLTDSDFPSSDYTFRIPEAYGQTYVVQLTINMPTYIVFPYNIDARGNDFSLYYISSTHDIYLLDYEEEWGDDLLSNNTIRTFIATNSTIAGSRWNEREVYWVQSNAIRTLSKYWFNTEPNSTTFKPHVFIGGSESRQLTVSAVQGLEDYTNTYVFRNTTPYTMTLPTATSNYGRVLRFYRDGTGLITIQRSGSDTFGRDLTSITLNDKQYVEMIAANNNQWLITAQSNLSGQQVHLLTSGNYAPTRYIDTIICTNTTTSTISPNAIDMGVGKMYTIKRRGTGDVIIDPNLSQTIDGKLTHTLTKINDAITIQSDGTNFNIIGKYVDSDYILTVTSTDVTLTDIVDTVVVNSATSRGVTLPYLSGVTNGKRILIKNINTGFVTIYKRGTDVLESNTGGSGNLVLELQWDSVVVKSVGNRWVIESFKNFNTLSYIPNHSVGGTPINLASDESRNCTYSRIGNAVTVFGTVVLQSSIIGQGMLWMSLPIPANFSDVTDLNGFGINQQTNSLMRISADPTYNVAQIYFNGNAALQTYHFSFQYLIG